MRLGDSDCSGNWSREQSSAPLCSSIGAIHHKYMAENKLQSILVAKGTKFALLLLAAVLLAAGRLFATWPILLKTT